MAKLIGQYDSSVAFGQSRVLLVWTRIIMPDGGSIVLERQPGADTQGGRAMTKLKLGPLADDKPVKISIELPPGSIAI